jgi:hypothetical protein
MSVKKDIKNSIPVPAGIFRLYRESDTFNQKIKGLL